MVTPALKHDVQFVMVHDYQVFFQKLLLDVLVQLLQMEAELMFHHFCMCVFMYAHTNSKI